MPLRCMSLRQVQLLTPSSLSDLYACPPAVHSTAVLVSSSCTSTPMVALLDPRQRPAGSRAPLLTLHHQSCPMCRDEQASYGLLNTRACQAGSGLFCACDACCLAHQQGWNAGCSAIQLFEMAPCICPVCMQYSVQLFQPQQSFSLHFHQCWGVVMFETCSCMLCIANPQP
jgi:hypothetical protein